MVDYKIGTVTHYYSELGVAIIDLQGPIHIGDRVRFSGDSDYSQLVESIQIEHEQVEMADKGESVGIKVKFPVGVGDEVVKLAA